MASKLDWARERASRRQRSTPMHDTGTEVEAQLRAMFHSRSPAERLRMATTMFGTATRLAIAGLRFEDPQLDGVALRLALLERLHGDDLDPSIRLAVAGFDHRNATDASSYRTISGGSHIDGIP